MIYFFHMKTTVLKYNVLIKKEGKQYISYVPTLGISDFGKNIEEAKKNTEKAIVFHVEGLIKTGDQVPSPDTQDFFISQSEVTVRSNIKFAF